MFDLVVRGGLVVVEAGVGRWDIGIADGRIGAIADPGILAGHAELDAADGIVIPGGIDPHVHCDWPVEDPRTGSILHTAGPDKVTEAALYGGITTVIDFAVCPPGEEPRAAVERTVRAWESEARCDYSYHVMLQDEITDDQLDAVGPLIEQGFPSFKVFMTNVRPKIQRRKVALGSIWELLKVTKERNGIVAVHGEDDELVMHMYAKLGRLGKTGYVHMPLVHSALSEKVAFDRVIALAEEVGGAKLYMMHVSAADAVRVITAARRRGLPVYGETLPQYALHTQEDYEEPDGMKYHTYPSLKSADDVAALWAGIVSGDISTFATDELCTSYEVKTAGTRIDNVVGGNVGLEPRMAILYTEMVVNRGHTLRDFVRLTSTNAARIMGMYPQKGAIAVGSDADLTILDTRAARTVRAADLHESDYTPWEGWHVDAWPTTTLLRGRIVTDGELRAAPGQGRLVFRRLPDDDSL